MGEDLDEPDDLDFWEQESSEIAEKFDIPFSTAWAWERNLGNIDVIERTLGENAPEGHLDLISRREWMPEERREIEDEWVEPLERWCIKKADNIYLLHDSKPCEAERLAYQQEGIERNPLGSRRTNLGNGWYAAEYLYQSPGENDSDNEVRPRVSDKMQEVREEFRKKEEQVKYEMKRFDSEWIALTRELRNVEKSLIETYESHLQNADREIRYKKDKIIELKEAFPYLRADNEFVARVVDCSVSYAKQFKGTPEGEVTNHNINRGLRDAVFDRDGNSCVSCGREEDLVIHHIIPHNSGGKTKKENLALLCEDCHYYAHGGGKPTDDGRYTAARWSSVEYSDREEFWNEWIEQDFENRSSDGPGPHRILNSDEL